MVKVTFTANIQAHLACPPAEVKAGTLREVLEQVFARNAAARGYVLDDQGAMRKHMVAFIDGHPVQDRNGLADAVPDGGEVYVMQALSGG